MKKSLFIAFAVLAVTALGFSAVYSQSTEPPSDLPIIDTTATATVQAYASSTATSRAVSTSTATPTVNEISAEDEADTGAEIYILAGLSLIAGFGIYFIKKYLDIKRYSI